eukprot:m.354795 g.354795  ORF g.354795 m.354795 type:complete len:76 (-) comp75282_c0_seq1:3-230(-)
MVFRGFDLNGDGKLQYEEYMLYLAATTESDMGGQLEAVFKMFDINDDGVLSVEELVNAHAFVVKFELKFYPRRPC